MDTQALVLQVRYGAWATRRTLDAAAPLTADELHRDLGNSYGGIHGTLVHIFQADSIWFDRLHGVPTAALSAYEAPPDFAAFSQTWLALLDRWTEWAEQLNAADWDRMVLHRNTQGVPDTQPAWHIALHVANHASYHRGQVTTMLRQLGKPAIGTDLITYYHSLAAATA
jgi:uncharacterized damage-inducible protein DinB